MTRFAAVPILGALLVHAAALSAQQTPAGPDVVVRNQRLPGAEAPRSQICEAMARDPLFRQQLIAAAGDPTKAPRLNMPTRMPRNPDYNAPPLVPAGSPIPDLGKARFGATIPVYGEQASVGYVQSAPEDTVEGFSPPGANPSILTSMEEAAVLCRTLYAAAGSGPRNSFVSPPSDGGDPRGSGATARLDARFAQARAQIAANDTTLPTAFALFDQRRFAESLPWFRKAANKLAYREGGDEATLFVGKLYLMGLGAQSQPAEGVKWLRKAALLPYDMTVDTPVFDPLRPTSNTAVGEAAIILANVYRTGFGGIPRDMVEACRWYERAEAVGHVPAAKMLGDIYRDGTGVKSDPAKAVTWYKRAAKLDFPDAQVALAMMLEDGAEGVGRDPKQAVAWYNAAARHNHGLALYALARAYDTGRGVAADQTRAMGFYKSAAIAGLPEAKTAIGTYFHQGSVVARDDAVARQWFEAAARDRDADGMYNLAALLANGRGGPRDLPGAWVWLKRAAAGGHADAPAALTKVEGLMTAEQKAAAAQKLRG